MTSISDLIDPYLEEMRRREFLFKMPDPKMPKEMIDSSIPTDNDDDTNVFDDINNPEFI